MNVTKATSTPFEFRFRALIIFGIFFVGFFAGAWLQQYLGSQRQTIVLLGQHWGQKGIDAFAWIAAGLTFACWAIRVWASSYHVPGVVMSEHVVTNTFTAAGPYRYVRNPLYFGNVLLALGIGMLGPPAATVLVVLLMVVFVYRLVAIEEKYLRETQGAAYAAYAVSVPRLLPRLLPADVPADERKPNFVNGFWTEFYMLGFTAAMAFVAVEVQSGGNTDVSPVFWAIAGVFFLFYYVGRAIAQGRGKAQV